MMIRLYEMVRRPVVTVTPEQRAELLRLRSAHPKLYVRERVAAMMQLAEGKTLGMMAEHGLLTPHQLETISAWAKRYRAERAVGLEMRSGRGRKRGKRLLPLRSP